MKNISFKRCFGVALLIGFLSNLLTIQKLHPYQNLYFSILAGKHPEKQFEVDFWGTTHLEALKKLILRKPEGEILLSVNSDWNYSALLGLPQEERIRFRIVPSAQAQYCIDDFRFREKKLYGSEIFRIEREGTPYLIVLEQKLDPVVSFPESVLPSRSETLTNLLNLRKEEIR